MVFTATGWERNFSREKFRFPLFRHGGLCARISRLLEHQKQ